MPSDRPHIEFGTPLVPMPANDDQPSADWVNTPLPLSILYDDETRAQLASRGTPPAHDFGGVVANDILPTITTLPPVATAPEPMAVHVPDAAPDVVSADPAADLHLFASSSLDIWDPGEKIELALATPIPEEVYAPAAEPAGILPEVAQMIADAIGQPLADIVPDDAVVASLLHHTDAFDHLSQMHLMHQPYFDHYV